MLNEMLLPTPTHPPTHPTATNPFHSIPFRGVAIYYIRWSNALCGRRCS